MAAARFLSPKTSASRVALRALARAACCGLLAVLCGCPPAPRGYARAELLWPDGAPGAHGERRHDRPTLFFYPAEAPASDTAAIVASGGSYGHHGGLRPEGQPTAQWLAARGITAIVLRYRVGEVGGYDHRAFFADSVRAIQTVRARAGELGVSAERIGIVGFSAGGHMAASLATRCADGSPVYAPGAAPPPDPALAGVSCRPDFAVAVYPVVTLEPPHAHARSRRNLLGDLSDMSNDALDPALLQLLSLERQATPAAAPLLIVHSRRDQKVPYQNSELLHEALTARGADSTLLLFDDGKHGVGLAQKPRSPRMGTWPTRMLSWLGARGLYQRPRG